MKLGIVEVGSGKTAWMDQAAAAYEYILGVKWLPDNRAVAVQTTNRPQTRLDLWLVARGTGAAKLVLTDVDEAWVNQKELQFLDGGKKFVVSSERDGHTHLYLYSIDGKLLNAVTQGPWSVRGPSGFYGAPLGSAWVDEPGGWIYFTALEKSPIERHLYRIHPDGTGMERLTKEDGQHRITMSPDRRAYADVHSSHDQLPSLSVHDAGGAQRAVVSPRAHGPRGALPVPDGVALHDPRADGFALPRASQAPRLRRLEEVPRDRLHLRRPGRAHRQRRVGLLVCGQRLFDQVLADRGYVVFSVDPRSATGQSKTLENTVVRKMMTDGELNDIVKGVKWLKAQPFVDPARVGVWGWSGGGTDTLLVMTRTQEFKAGISVAPVTDWHFYDTKFAETYMKTPTTTRTATRSSRDPAREGPPRPTDDRLRQLRRQRPSAERMELHRRAHQGEQALRHDGLPDAQAPDRGSTGADTCSRRCWSSGSSTSNVASARCARSRSRGATSSPLRSGGLFAPRATRRFESRSTAARLRAGSYRTPSMTYRSDSTRAYEMA